MRHDECQRTCPERLHELRMLRIELTCMIDNGRTLLFGMRGQQLHVLRRDLLRLLWAYISVSSS